METGHNMKNPISAHADSDPTYEAWKHVPKEKMTAIILLIPILPMRHGNSIATNPISLPAEIPILPMRHGNA